MPHLLYSSYFFLVTFKTFYYVCMYALSSRHFANVTQIRMFVCTYIRTHVHTSVLHAAHVAEMYMCMHVCTRYVCQHICWTLPHGLDTTYVYTVHTIGVVLSLYVYLLDYTILYCIFTSRIEMTLLYLKIRLIHTYTL